jgi:hypothetical protein
MQLPVRAVAEVPTTGMVKALPLSPLLAVSEWVMV